MFQLGVKDENESEIVGLIGRGGRLFSTVGGNSIRSRERRGKRMFGKYLEKVMENFGVYRYQFFWEQFIVLNYEVIISFVKSVQRFQDNQNLKTIYVKMEFLFICLGLTWQNIDIFFLIVVSRGFEYLYTIQQLRK